MGSYVATCNKPTPVLDLLYKMFPYFVQLKGPFIAFSKGRLQDDSDDAFAGKSWAGAMRLQEFQGVYRRMENNIETSVWGSGFDA